MSRRAARYVRQWNDKHQARCLSCTADLMIIHARQPHDCSHWPESHINLRLQSVPSLHLHHSERPSYYFHPSTFPSRPLFRRRRPALVSLALSDRKPFQPYQPTIAFQQQSFTTALVNNGLGGKNKRRAHRPAVILLFRPRICNRQYHAFPSFFVQVRLLGLWSLTVCSCGQRQHEHEHEVSCFRCFLLPFS